MHKRQLTVIGIVLIAGAILFAITTYRQQAQDKLQIQQEEEATIVQKGEPKTEREKAYSKKFSNGSKLKLSDGIKYAQEKNWKGEILRSVVSEPNQGFRQFSAPKFLQFLVCTSDAVVIGSTKSKTAKLTEDESWVYTEYDFLVKEVLKRNPSASLGKNENIQISRSGGLVKLDGYVFRVENTAIQQLKKDKDYLLFLNYVPEANGYIANNSFGDFVLEDDRLVSLSKAPLPKKIKTDNDYQTITNDIRSSVERGCDLDSNGGN
jgi:hypothetical protein